MSAEKLAINGGKPIRKDFLPYGRQWLDDEDIYAVVNILKGDYLTTGPTIEAFEKAVADYVGASYAVAFSNGTAALHGACFAAGINKGDEVITTPLTFAASANCILYQGGIPVFSDVDPISYNIDPKCIEANITEKTKAIIPVDYTGLPAALDQIQDLAKKHNLIVIEDAAHGLGAQFKGKPVGALSDMTMFSFHPVKHITTGEGGIITTNNEGYFHLLKQFRSHGICKETHRLSQNPGPWYHEMQILGYNYRMTDIQAALGMSQLKKLDRFLQIRRKYAHLYNEAFSGIEGLKLPVHTDEALSSWHLYILRLDLKQFKASRREIYEALLKENIGVNVHYIPVYYHPYYQQLGYCKGLCPRAEALYEEMITLPLFPAMTLRDVRDVIQGVEKVISYYHEK